MTPLARLLLRHALAGFGIAVAVVAAMLWADFAGLRALIAASEAGPLALFMLTFFMGLTFGSAQMGIAIMMLGRRGGVRDSGHRAQLAPAPAWPARPASARHWLLRPIDRQ